MRKILLAGGDSFTYGSELPDCTNTVFSNMSWSALIAKRKQLDYNCIAKPGSGNASIMRRVIESVESTDNIGLVAVMWTWPGRIEIKANDHINGCNVLTELTHEVPDGWIDVSVWNAMSFDERINMMPAKNDPNFVKGYKNLYNAEKKIGLDDLARTYFTIASNYHLLYQSAQYIFTLQCYLEKKNIDYVFAATTDHLLEMFTRNDIPLTNLIDKTKWISIDKGLYQWALENNYPISPMNHPVAQAHEDWLNACYQD